MSLHMLNCVTCCWHCGENHSVTEPCGLKFSCGPSTALAAGACHLRLLVSLPKYALICSSLGSLPFVASFAREKNLVPSGAFLFFSIVWACLADSLSSVDCPCPMAYSRSSSSRKAGLPAISIAGRFPGFFSLPRHLASTRLYGGTLFMWRSYPARQYTPCRCTNWA